MVIKAIFRKIEKLSEDLKQRACVGKDVLTEAI